MSKEEIIKKYSEQYKVEAPALEQKWAEFEKTGTGFGYQSEELQNYCKNRLLRYFAKRKLSQGILNKVAIIGMSLNDYGNNKTYAKANEAWTTDPQKAISNGLCDEQGNPIYIKGKRKGEIMNPKEYTMKTCYCVKQLIEEGKENPWEITKFDIPCDTVVPLATISEVYLSPSQTAGVSYCNNAEFLVKTKLAYSQLCELAKEFYTEIKLRDAPGWIQEHENQYDAICYSIVDLAGFDFLANSPSNLIHICDKIEGYEEPSVLSGWISKTEELKWNIEDGAENLLVFHRPYGDATVTNVYGASADNKYLKKVTPEQITPEKSQEEVQEKQPTPAPKEVAQPAPPKPVASQPTSTGGGWNNI